ncbi:MAG: glucoamylase family protein, partial [Burkholderiaceae bacterium]
LDPVRRRVASGYAILQPRVAVPLPRPGTVTPFHWLFSGQWGIDPYAAASSEIYQDVFGEGTFTGKGLLNVQAVQAMLSNRLPQGQVLSHDLLEGSLARCAAVSDVTLVEDTPAHPDVAASRAHRWTRGDWQLLPFIQHPRAWPMAGINRWKMFDNLRRSLVAPLSLLLLMWALGTGAVGLGIALLVVAAAYGAGPLIGAVAGLAPPRDDISLALFFTRAGTGVLRAIGGAAWHLLQLPAEALLSVDASVRALARQYVSRRGLLQWTTAAAAQAAARTDLPSLLRRHRRVPVLVAALGALLLVVWGGTAAPATRWGAGPCVACALLLFAAWAIHPIWIWIASRRLPAAAPALDASGRERVRDLARDTWNYYARFVGEADHHLPPDNVQFTESEPTVAHRTSPTNIGLYLLSTAAAHEMGFIAPLEMVLRLERTLATLDRLPRWRGHFYNWIDTRSLATLAPSYVSAVDSGNLSGHLLVLSAACDAFANDAASSTHDVDADFDTAAADTASDALTPHQLRHRLRRLSAHARTIALAADFRALYDPRRELLHIGYDVDADRLDAGHYDLLASEARLASLVAIAKGDLPPRHWAALGRPVFAVSPGVGATSGWAALGRVPGVGLKSWSGSMFEYLMPSLVLEEPAGSLLYEAIHAAVAEQRRDALPRGTPWGVSESAIAVQDHTLAYQYGPQGVARLALRRTPSDERVIAPYASVMALLVAPQAAADNLRALESLGARHALGFIESLDYTAHRQPAGSVQPFTPVLAFMAHHQAMSLLACAHVLTDAAVQRWASAQPHLRAVMPLLHERAPHVAPPLRTPPLVLQPRALQGQRWQFEIQPARNALLPTHLL